MATQSATSDSVENTEENTTGELQIDRQLTRIRAYRRGNRSVVTKLQGEVTQIIQTRSNLYTEPDVLSRLQSISDLLKAKQDYLRRVSDEILELCSIEQIDKEIEDCSEWETRILETLEKIVLFKQGRYTSISTRVGNDEEAQAVPAISTPVRAGISAAEITTNQSFNGSLQSHSSMGNLGLKLPKISLPRFAGDITSFPTFWQSFECTVHRNANVPAIQKFSYLLSLVDGNARRALEGLELTEGNYEHAIEILKTRFGNKQQIINEHMAALLRLQGHSNEKTPQLRYIFDKITVHVRGLESLGMPAERYGSLLIPIIMDRMPKEITTQIARKITQEIWPIDEILEIIGNEIAAREFSEKAAISNRRPQEHTSVSRSKPLGTTQSFITKTENRSLKNSPRVCTFCKGEHLSLNCSTITDIRERKAIILREGVCFCCLNKGHRATDCSKRCRKCGGQHHQTICFRIFSANKGTESEQDTTTSVSATTKSRKNGLMMTASAFVYGEDSAKKTRITMLFDSGSQRSYVSEDLRKKLNLPADSSETINLNTFGTDKYTKVKVDSVVLNVEVENNEVIPVSALTHSVICTPISSRVSVGNFPHLQGLKLADCFETKHSKRIDMLIGLDSYFQFIQGDVIRGNPNEPVALKSKLGWILSGNVCSNNPYELSCVSSNLILEGYPNENTETLNDQEINSTLKDFWRHEECGLLDVDNNDNADKGQRPEFENAPFNLKNIGERYEANLPFDSISIDSLPSNYELCFGRLQSLRKKLYNNPQLLEEYNAIIQEQLKTGIIERVNLLGKEQDNCHFLPHHCVVRQDHETTKVRIVFDASAKETKETPSLNDLLSLGDNFMPFLFDTIMRFRSHVIGITADIQKAFHQISINESDRDFLRFLWFDDIHKAEPSVIQLRFCRLPFGLKPSPSILGATIHKHASLVQEEEPHIAAILKRMYADDMTCGAETPAEAVEIFTKSKAIMKRAGFNLCKFKSNDATVLNEIAHLEAHQGSKASNESVSEDLQTFSQSTVGLPYNESDNKTKVLGINWDTKEDVFFYDLSKLVEYSASLPPTKRSLLKIAAKIFDPLGCLSVYSINLKILFQQLCEDKLPWDEELHGEARTRFNQLLRDMNVIQGVHIPRSLFVKGNKISSIQIHAFSDASQAAYAAVVYLRILYDSGELDIKFLASKAKVSPLKKQSIPRLELIGAALMAKLVSTINSTLQDELGYYKPIKTYYWVDSMATLCWIVNNRHWKQFVRRRVEQILQFSSREDWYFFPGALNPADLPSRGKYGHAYKNNPLWWEGPTFLKLPPTEWPKVENMNDLQESAAYAEEISNPVKVTHAMANVNEETRSITNIVEVKRFSSKNKALRVISWVLRFINNLKIVISKSGGKQMDKEVSADEMKCAEMLLIRDIQKEVFKEELKFLLCKSNKNSKAIPSNVNQLNLFIDEHDILRCRSRLRNASIMESGKCPILLPAHNLYSELVVWEAHNLVFHNGIGETLSCLRQKYWVLRGRELVKKQIRKCTICKKLEGLPFKFSVTPDLPLERVSDCAPFTNAGVDFAGPLITKGLTGQNTIKSYICLFTCGTTRAVHLEVVESLDTQSFIRAFRRFAARRGLPETMISDNAKTFKAMSKEVRKVLLCPKLSRFLAQRVSDGNLFPKEVHGKEACGNV